MLHLYRWALRSIEIELNFFNESLLMNDLKHLKNNLFGLIAFVSLLRTILLLLSLRFQLTAKRQKFCHLNGNYMRLFVFNVVDALILLLTASGTLSRPDTRGFEKFRDRLVTNSRCLPNCILWLFLWLSNINLYS